MISLERRECIFIYYYTAYEFLSSRTKLMETCGYIGLASYKNEPYMMDKRPAIEMDVGGVVMITPAAAAVTFVFFCGAVDSRSNHTESLGNCTNEVT